MSDPSVPRFAYRAFISYSHRDKAWADWLHRTLETYRVPSRLVGIQTAHGTIPRRLNPIFRDREELASAAELGRKVNEALGQSENLIVICSPASATSRWVSEEVLAYKRMGRAERIFCLIVDGEPDASDIPGHEAEECFCPALRFATDMEGRPTTTRTEPIAADARPGKDGKPNAKLKLIAGMLDVGFDALKHREQQRRVRRMTTITAIAMCVMAVTIVLAIAALVSRHRAVSAEQEAKVAQQAAERRQKQAEGLVDFMLGNLSDKLNKEARLDIMQDVDNKAMAYFASLPPTDVNDTALAQRARALEKIGNMRQNLGNLPGALEAYRASTTISSKLAAAESTNIKRQVAYSWTLSYIGWTHYQQGNLTDAEHDWQTARQVLQPSLERAPNDLPLLWQLTNVDANLDHVLAAQGRPDSALKLTREWLELDQRLVKAKPNDVDYGSDLGDAHNELGRLSLQRGELAAAIAEYRTDDGIETKLSEQDPRNTGQIESKLLVRAILGRTLAIAGDNTTGMRDLQQAIELAEQLAKFDPKVAEYRKYVALYSSQLARLQRLNGNLPAARILNDQAVTILAALVKTDPTNRGWQSYYAEAVIEQAAESLADGDTGAANTRVQAALHILEPMLAKQPDERDTLLAAMTAKLLLASVTNDTLVAQNLRRQALATVQAVKADHDDPRLLALQAEALLALNRSADAQPPIKQLWGEGYRDPAFVGLLLHERIAYPVNPAFQARLLAAAHTGDGDSRQRAGGKQHP